MSDKHEVITFPLGRDEAQALLDGEEIFFEADDTVDVEGFVIEIADDEDGNPFRVDDALR